MARELDPSVGTRPGEEVDVAVVTALEDQVVDVLDRGRQAHRLILPVNRSEGDERLDGEAEVERDFGVVRIVREPVEGGGVGDGFSAARVADQGDVGQVHLVMKRVLFLFVPGSPQLEVLEQQPARRSARTASRLAQRDSRCGGRSSARYLRTHAPREQRLPVVPP